jgi:hypothetical protein
MMPPRRGGSDTAKQNPQFYKSSTGEAPVPEVRLFVRSGKVKILEQ